MNNKHLAYIIERVGLSHRFDLALITEIIAYTYNSNILVRYGTTKSICVKVRLLYYSGYTDLSIEEGVIQILKDIEIKLDPNIFYKGNAFKPSLINNPRVINLKAFFKASMIAKRVFNFKKLRVKKRIHSITQLNASHLVDPLLHYKLIQRQLKIKFKNKGSIKNILIIEDVTSSMTNSITIEKSIGVLNTILKIFPDSNITKYQCYKYITTKVEPQYITDITYTGEFNLEHYLNILPKSDLTIVITDALPYELRGSNQYNYTIVFNLNVQNTPCNLTNITQIQI